MKKLGKSITEIMKERIDFLEARLIALERKYAPECVPQIVKYDPVAKYTAKFGDQIPADVILRIAGQLEYKGSQSATNEHLKKLSHELYVCANMLKAIYVPSRFVSVVKLQELIRQFQQKDDPDSANLIATVLRAELLPQAEMAVETFTETFTGYANTGKSQA